jgi:ABC-type xylose transport system permease subunit
MTQTWTNTFRSMPVTTPLAFPYQQIVFGVVLVLAVALTIDRSKTQV